MSCPSARRSLIRVATLVLRVSFVSADKLRAFPLFNAASIFDFVVCFIVVGLRVTVAPLLLLGFYKFNRVAVLLAENAHDKLASFDFHKLAIFNFWRGCGCCVFSVKLFFFPNVVGSHD